MDNLFIREAKLFVKNGLIAGKAEAFILSLLANSKQGIKYPIVHNNMDSDVVISDLEPQVPDYEEFHEYAPDTEFEEEVNSHQYLKLLYCGPFKYNIIICCYRFLLT